MAVISDLVRAVAKAEGIDEDTVALFARRAREGGFISQKGRGRSAAQMSVSDAANLIIGVNGSVSAPDVGVEIARYRALRTTAFGMRRVERSPLRTVTNDLSFGSAIEGLLALCHPAALPSLEISLDREVGKQDRAKALAKNIQLPRTRIEIEFRRPATRAQIKIVRPAFYQNRLYESTIHDVEFEAEGDDVAGLHDRRDTVVITDVTLRTVAAVLAEPANA
jgi:hypothetical protein